MSNDTKFDQLRAKVAEAMQDELRKSGRINASWETRKRAMSKGVAYRQVLQMIDEIQKPPPEQSMVVDCPDCGGGDSTCLYCDGEGTVIE